MAWYGVVGRAIGFLIEWEVNLFMTDAAGQLPLLIEMNAEGK